MSLESLEAGDLLTRGAESLGVALTDGQRDALLAFQALLMKWNRVYNLTAVRKPTDMLTHHLFDSLAVLPPLRRQLLAGSFNRLLDVGSGGGLPGVVLALMLPEVAVTCVDTVGKKASFVHQAAVELKLGNLTAVHARVETMREPLFDVIISRAFASLLDFTRLTRSLISPQGVWVAMKGKTPTLEMADLPADLAVFHVEQLVVPGLDAERCLVWIRPSPG